MTKDIYIENVKESFKLSQKSIYYGAVVSFLILALVHTENLKIVTLPNNLGSLPAELGFFIIMLFYMASGLLLLHSVNMIKSNMSNISGSDSEEIKNALVLIPVIINGSIFNRILSLLIPTAILFYAFKIVFQGDYFTCVLVTLIYSWFHIMALYKSKGIKI